MGSPPAGSDAPWSQHHGGNDGHGPDSEGWRAMRSPGSVFDATPHRGRGRPPEEQLEADLVRRCHRARLESPPMARGARIFPRTPGDGGRLRSLDMPAVSTAADNRERDWKALLSQANSPHFNRAGVLFPLEGDRWLVSLAGLGRDYPPDGGVRVFSSSCEGLPHPGDVRDDPGRRAPQSPPSARRATENRVRHYERLSNWPDGLIVLGRCSMLPSNPVFGQGHNDRRPGPRCYSTRVSGVRSDITARRS